MKTSKVIEILENSPVITAVKNDRELEASLKTDSGFVFILYGDLSNIHEILNRVKREGKLAIVHIDLVDGLSAREAAVDFLADNARADGVISTKIQLLRKAKSKGMITVQRFFLLDSLSLKKIHQQSDFRDVDLVEILPGCMPKIIKSVCERIPVPVIAGGLIQEKDDIVQALAAGAAGVSSSDPRVWEM